MQAGKGSVGDAGGRPRQQKQCVPAGRDLQGAAAPCKAMLAHAAAVARQAHLCSHRGVVLRQAPHVLRLQAAAPATAAPAAAASIDCLRREGGSQRPVQGEGQLLLQGGHQRRLHRLLEQGKQPVQVLHLLLLLLLALLLNRQPCRLLVLLLLCQLHGRQGLLGRGELLGRTGLL